MGVVSAVVVAGCAQAPMIEHPYIKEHFERPQRVVPNDPEMARKLHELQQEIDRLRGRLPLRGKVDAPSPF